MKSDRALLLEKEPFTAIAAPCVYVGACGGCTIQDLAYEHQVELKTRRLLRAFAEFDPTLPIDVTGMDDPWRYRNKAELTFSQAAGHAAGRSLGGPPSASLSGASRVSPPPANIEIEAQPLALGYHAAGSFWRIVDLDECLLLPEPMVAVMRETRALARDTGLPAYNPKRHDGFFRYLTLRHSRATGKLLVCLITAPGHREVVEGMARTLVQRHPDIQGLYWGVSRKLADIAVPDEMTLLHGDAWLDDRVGPFEIKVHPQSFLQPNPVQAERLYARLTELVDHAPSGAAWDLYCGLGLIGFHLAKGFGTVHGVDVDQGNFELARANAAANGLTNLQFQAGAAEDLLANKRYWLVEAKPDLVVVDPPRSGLHERVISTILSARPRQVVYVSCNLQALARDLRLLMNSFPRYRLRHVQGFDFFPHTSHLEILTLLERL